MTDAPSPQPSRLWLYVALGFIGFWGLYLIFLGPSANERVPQLQSPGNLTADYSWAVADLDGNPVTFDRFKGKAVFLNIWATWCPPCVGELPSIARLAANPALKDVAFICAATDETRDDVKRFVERQGKEWTMTVLHATDLPPVFVTEGIPATFLIAPDGRIVSAEIGAADWDDPKVVDFLKNLASTAKPAGPESQGPTAAEK